MPAIDIATADKLYKRLKTSFDLHKLFGITLEGTDFAFFVQRLAELIGTKETPVDYASMRATVSHLLGDTLTYKNVDFLFKFLSVNFIQLRKGYMAMPADGSAHPGWACIRFYDLERLDRDGKIRLALKANVEWGTWYGHKVERVVDMFSPVVAVALRRLNVVTRRNKNATPRDLIGLYAFAELESSDFGREKLSFSAVMCNDYLKRVNAQLIKERRKPCIKGYLHPCSACHLGIKDCFRATRPIAITIEGKVDDANQSGQSAGDAGEVGGGFFVDESAAGPGAQLRSVCEEGTSVSGCNAG